MLQTFNKGETQCICLRAWGDRKVNTVSCSPAEKDTRDYYVNAFDIFGWNRIFLMRYMHFCSMDDHRPFYRILIS